MRTPTPISTILPVVLGLSVALGAAALPAQDLGPQVLELMRLADRSPLTSVWQIARQLSDLGEKEEQLATAITAQLGKVKAQGRLAAAAALQEITDGAEFGSSIYEALEPLLGGKVKTDVAEAAFALASRDVFFNSRTRRELRKRISPVVQSDLTDPRVRVSAARTLWRVGSTEEQRTAKKTLLDFVRSSDRSLRIMGALALAEINADSSNPGWPILREIAEEPTPEGRLAATYLRIENQRRTFDAMLRQISREGLAKSGGTGDQPPEPGKTTEFALLREILGQVSQQHVRGDKVANDKLIQQAAKGLLGALDRHSTYLSSEEYQKFYFDLNPEYGGIGAFVNFDADNVFSIVRPIYSGPAYQANLRSGDKILEVEGWETAGHTSDEIISRLKGKPGTQVKIKVFRRGWSEPKEVAVTRRQIQVPSVNFELLPGDVGYIEIVTFGGATSQELAKAITMLRGQNIKGLVLDLRNNTGGYLEIAREVVELFVKGKKMVVYTQGRGGPKAEYKTADRAILPEMPLAVLINGFSASASEITAGALQDYKRAVIVGERSFGKGSVQSLIPLRVDPPEPFKDDNRNGQWDRWETYKDLNENGRYDIGARLKLTVAHYFLPSGRCVDKQLDLDGKVIDPDWGVTPDRPLPLLYTDVRDRWKEAVIFDLLEKDVFGSYVDKHIDANKALFVELAEGDLGSVEKYPEFEAFYTGLDTRLTKDDIRKWLRFAIRDRVADLRGKAFPGGRAVGDFQEDAQLQEGIRVVLSKRGADMRTIPSYKDVLKISFDEKKPAEEKK